ncbi:MAG: PAS domain S-box protein [Bacteroidota bacterium]
MVKKINRTVILIIGFVTILIVGNQIVIRQYEISSDTLLLEYHEMHALQEFKFSLELLQNYCLDTKNQNIHLNKIDSLLANVDLMRINCEKYVTKRHLDLHWDKVLAPYNKLASMSLEYIPVSDYKNIKSYINEIQLVLDNMILETKEEIRETEDRNFTLQKHGTLTLLSVGILFIIIISILSAYAAKNISTPIQELLSTFKKLGAGGKNIRATIKSNDEFEQLASEFNSMIDQLENTTVTLEYVRNIIDSIYGALFVTDNNGVIISCNKTVTKLLGYEKSELINSSITRLFISEDGSNGSESKKNNLLGERLKKYLNESELIKCRNGKTIPVLTTCTSLETNDEEGLIVVVHDITEKIEYQKQLEESKRKTLAAINEAQEVERTRIATELHDSLGQKLSAIFYALQNTLEDKKDTGKIKDIQKLVDETISETRSISHSIMPGALKDFGLCAALKGLVDTTNKLQDISCSFNHYDFETRPNPTIEKVVYRICQEALNNILKHSKASNAVIQLFKSKDLLTLMIEDDGVGFNVEELDANMNKGIGLLSIKERVAFYKGILTINSSPNNGTEIIVEIPCMS